MDDETRARVLELLDRPLASLTVREGLFLVAMIEEHEDELAALVPELAVLLSGESARP